MAKTARDMPPSSRRGRATRCLGGVDPAPDRRMPRMNRFLAASALLAALPFVACYDAPTEPERSAPRRAIDVSQGWEQAAPAEVGFDAAELAAAIAS
ncbi:MAG TPA: hypothetical protein VFZ93_08870, partial [Albitalea sp.]